MEDLFFKLLLLEVVICVSSIIPSHTRAQIADFDGVWKQRAEEAMKHAKEAYNPYPHDVTNHFNHNVTKRRAGIAIRNADGTKWMGRFLHVKRAAFGRASSGLLRRKMERAETCQAQWEDAPIFPHIGDASVSERRLQAPRGREEFGRRTGIHASSLAADLGVKLSVVLIGKLGCLLVFENVEGFRKMLRHPSPCSVLGDVHGYRATNGEVPSIEFGSMDCDLPGGWQGLHFDELVSPSTGRSRCRLTEWISLVGWWMSARSSDISAAGSCRSSWALRFRVWDFVSVLDARDAMAMSEGKYAFPYISKLSASSDGDGAGVPSFEVACVGSFPDLSVCGVGGGLEEDQIRVALRSPMMDAGSAFGDGVFLSWGWEF
ncbi:hypothetical protein Dimus_023913 [Dionaea muscipula]